MNRKGVDQNAIKNGILALIILLVLIVVFSNTLKVIPFISENTKCETYTRLASSLKNPYTKDTRIDMNRACPTEQKTLLAQGSNPDEIRKNALDAILQEMYLCGKRWGFSEGEVKRNPFSQWNVDNVCVVCSDMEFDDTLKGMNSLDGLMLRATEAKNPDGKTYYEFFTGIPPSSGIKEKLQEKVDGETESINTQENQYVIYAVNMRTTTEGFLTRMGLGALFGAGTGAAVGVTTAGATVPLRPLLFVLRMRMYVVKPLFIIGFVTGAIGGGYVGANVRGQADGALLIAPAAVEDIQKFCKTLGRDPLEDPWEEDF